MPTFDAPLIGVFRGHQMIHPVVILHRPPISPQTQLHHPRVVQLKWQPVNVMNATRLRHQKLHKLPMRHHQHHIIRTMRRHQIPQQPHRPRPNLSSTLHPTMPRLIRINISRHHHLRTQLQQLNVTSALRRRIRLTRPTTHLQPPRLMRIRMHHNRQTNHLRNRRHRLRSPHHPTDIQMRNPLTLPTNAKMIRKLLRLNPPQLSQTRIRNPPRVRRQRRVLRSPSVVLRLPMSHQK